MDIPALSGRGGKGLEGITLHIYSSCMILMYICSCVALFSFPIGCFLRRGERGRG